VKKSPVSHVTVGATAFRADNVKTPKFYPQ